MARGGRSGNSVRIIGGEHRGRKLPFPDEPGLRPTGDRIRETLFNWLQPRFPGASCLDLFAGSGALGLEASSRGAGKVLMLDSSSRVVSQLQENISLLGLNKASVIQIDALEWLKKCGKEKFEVVFLDPPFADGLLADACALLAEGSYLQPNALIYLEMDAKHDLPSLPPTWVQLKAKKAGQVFYYLYTVGEG